MDSDERVGEFVDFFKALGEPNRLRIVGLLLEGPRGVEDLCASLRTSAGLVAHHLARLAAVGLVTVASEDGEERYHLRADLLSAMTRKLLGQAATSAADRREPARAPSHNPGLSREEQGEAEKQRRTGMAEWG